MKNTPVTRFAPSPTGGLHLGSARTAIFNWLFARHHQGKFLLRIEDTDQQRSNQAFVNDILQALQWLKINDYDDDIYYQMQHQKQHLYIAEQMVKNGHAYRCYCTPEELTAQREEDKKSGRPPKYSGKCRPKSNGNCCPKSSNQDHNGNCCPKSSNQDHNGNCCPKSSNQDHNGNCCPKSSNQDHNGNCCPKYNGNCRPKSSNQDHLNHKCTKPCSCPYAIRLMMPQNEEIVIQDLIQGKITWQSKDLDDFVLVRSDGIPTYMLSVVVDDHNMGITHVIRGSDHLSNTPKQYLIYQAMAWQSPIFAHVPLIHTTNNVKLSKRHGAVTVQEYRDQGLLPDALFNYLLRLGWSYGNEEIISHQQAKDWFNTKNLGKSAAKFDMVKLLSINKHYMQALTTDEIMQLMAPFWQKLYHRCWNAIEEKRLHYLMPELQIRSNTLLALAEACGIIRTLDCLECFSTKADKILKKNLCHLSLIYEFFSKISSANWQKEHLQEIVSTLTEEKDLNKSALAQTIRAAITGSHISPGIYDVMYCLGQQETLCRIMNTIRHYRMTE